MLQRLQTAFAHVAIDTKKARDDKLTRKQDNDFLMNRRNDNTSDCINKKPEEWSI